MRDAIEVKDEFEEALSSAMRRVEAPESLERFLTAAVEAEASAATRRPRWSFAAAGWLSGWRMWAGAAVAATVLGGAFLGEQMHQRREARQAEIAQQQFEVAIGITNHALDRTRAQLERAGVTLGD